MIVVVKGIASIPFFLFINILYKVPNTSKKKNIIKIHVVRLVPDSSSPVLIL
jgi:hypothetical protein